MPKSRSLIRRQLELRNSVFDKEELKTSMVYIVKIRKNRSEFRNRFLNDYSWDTIKSTRFDIFRFGDREEILSTR